MSYSKNLKWRTKTQTQNKTLVMLLANQSSQWRKSNELYKGYPKDESPITVEMSVIPIKRENKLPLIENLFEHYNALAAPESLPPPALLAPAPQEWCEGFPMVPFFPPVVALTFGLGLNNLCPETFGPPLDLILGFFIWVSFQKISLIFYKNKVRFLAKFLHLLYQALNY
jgi:hypothetical protein